MPDPASWINDVSIDSAMDVNAGIARWVRLTGTEDERKAFDYIDEVVQGYGLTTTMHESTCLVSLPISGSLLVNDEPFTSITHSFSTSTPDDGTVGQLVYVGSGSDQDFAAAETSGRIVLTEGLATPQKAVAASAAGARAMICISGDPVHEMTLSPVWGSPIPATLPVLPVVPTVSVGSESGETLKAMLDQGPSRARVTTVVDTRWRPIPTLIADLDTDGREYVLFSGHVDSWHYGAMDNGSANATMIEVARVLATHRNELRRGVRFAFWSGHSQARYAGSTWFVDTYWFDLRERCVAHVNVDSTGGIGASDLTGGQTMADTFDFARGVIERQTGQKLEYNRVGRSSDQSFWGVGLPSVLTGVSRQGDVSGLSAELTRLVGGTSARSGGLGWWWHTTEDTLDKIDPANLERDTKIYVEVVGLLATEPIIPFDIRKSLNEMLEALDGIENEWAGLPQGGPDDSCGFDLLREDLTLALEAAGRLMDSITSNPPDEGAAARVSRSISNACKELIPANYTRSAEFGHDLALGTSTLPSLRPDSSVIGMTDDELWGATHQLRRSLNRVRNSVQRARRNLDEVL